MYHSGTEARCSDARCSRRRLHGSRGSSTSHRSRYSGPKDPSCERDRGHRKEVLVDSEFLDQESLMGTEDLATRQDPGNPGLGLPEACLRSVAARKA